MTQATAEVATAATSTISPARAWVLHLWAFVLPLLTMAFLWTGPHTWWTALLWTAPVWILVAIDNRAGADLRQPRAAISAAWPFDLQLYALFSIQLANNVLLAVMASQLRLWPASELGTTAANFLATGVICGTTAGYSGITLAHELIHRRKPHQFLMGRVLLMFVCYEHFATEHVRGHHPRVGTPDDPATARFDEQFRAFFLRTVPAQFKSAFHLEKVRLGDPDMSLFDRRMLRHRVLQGVIAQIAIAVGYLYFAGVVGLLFFLIQARTAIMLLEAVNYIEHWGLTRRGKAVTTVDSWDTDNWFTLHTLIGLSRHADHHARASRPFYGLRRFGESPKMPAGYYGTVLMAVFRNATYRERATAELQQRKLGPFRAPEEQTAPLHSDIRQLHDSRAAS